MRMLIICNSQTAKAAACYLSYDFLSLLSSEVWVDMLFVDGLHSHIQVAHPGLANLQVRLMMI